MNIIETIKSWFKPNENKLRAEAVARASELFNIINEEGTSYILYNSIKISTGEEDDGTLNLVKKLYALRRMYVELYVKNEGRI